MNFILKNAIKIFLTLQGLIILFHLSILVNLIPYEITWGGRLKNDTEMYIFETISILINIFLAWILAMKGNFVKYQFSLSVVHKILWVFCGIFTLNTIGNIFAVKTFEKSFTVLTALSALLIWKIITRKNTTNQ